MRLLAVISMAALAACSGLGESATYKSQAARFMADGRLGEAVLTYRQALTAEPDDPSLLSGLGMALAAQGRHRSAARTLHQATLLKPEDAVSAKALANLIIRPEDGLSLKLAWIVGVAEDQPVGAAAASGRIFVVYASGRLLALKQASGQVLWDTRAPVPLVSPPAADTDQVWVGAEDGSILVFAAKSGQMLGSYRTEGAVYAAPTLSSDTAYCVSNDGSLYALRRNRFELVWKAAIGQALHASPLLGNQSVYVGSNDGHLYRLKASTGERIWPDGILTQGAIESVPSLADGRVYVGSGDGRIYALDATTGHEYWHFSTPDAIYAQPLVLNQQLIVASSGQVLASIQISDGIPSWSLHFEHPITEAPVVFKDRLYTATRGDPRLFAVDPQTGRFLGDLNTGDWIAAGPLAAGTDLILVGQDGAVFLYR